MRKSYSVLQDDLFNFMRAAGYNDVERGERGSSEEHLTVTQFKVEQEQHRLKELDMAKTEAQAEIVHLQEEKSNAQNETNEVKARLDDLAPKLKNMALKGLLLLRQCCCHTGLLSSSVNVDNLQKSAKLDVLEAYVSNLYESNHKILIFSQFTKMLAFIRKRLEGFGYHIFYLDGQTRERQSVVDDFEKAENGVFLISLKAGGTGLNLVSAQDIIIYDPWWNPFAEEQAADRAYRIGQKNNVTVYKMIISDSIEEKILDLQRDKYQLFDDTLNHIPSDQNIFLDDILALL